MSKKDFDDFLRKEEEEKKPEINWDHERDWWLNQVDSLYININTWLSEYIQSEKIFINLLDIQIYEERLGMYEAKKMQIKIREKTAELTPIGTILLGTRGRVDMIGVGGIIRFILADRDANKPKIEVIEYLLDEGEEKKEGKPKEINWVWKIASFPPDIKYTELNQDSFLDALMQVCNG